MQTSTSNIEASSCNLQPTLSSIGNESVTKHLTQKIVKKIRVSITFKVAKGIGVEIFLDVLLKLVKEIYYKSGPMDSDVACHPINLVTTRRN